MSLTPLDIQNKEFSRSFRGYNETEVDDFLDRVVRDFNGLLKDNSALREQVEQLTTAIDQYRRLEDTLHNTLVVAQQTAEELKASARREADLIVADARRKAEQLEQEAMARARLGREAAEELIRRARVYQAQIKGALTAQLQMLEDEGRRLDEATAEMSAAITNSLEVEQSAQSAEGSKADAGVTAGSDQGAVANEQQAVEAV